VGFIAAPFAASPLGMTGFAQVFFILPMLFAIVIIAISLRQARAPLLPPQRALIAIHLAPLSLLASAGVVLGYPVVAVLFAGLAIAFAGFLIAKARWIIAAGFTPLWGAFTFPSAAFAVAMLSLAPISPIFMLVSIPALIAAIVIVSFITFRLILMCLSGALAEKTNAATA